VRKQSLTEAGHRCSETSLEVRHRQALDRLADRIVGLGLSVPALFFIESVRPLNFVSSQLMYFLSPLLSGLWVYPDYETVAEALERRQALDYLLRAVEVREAKS
jgi:hypothetical protein